MTKLEKVTRALERCNSNAAGSCVDCPYNNERNDEDIPHCLQHLLYEILELLKEQEQTKPVRNLGITRCGNCNCEIDKYEGIKYCPNCGKAVKWE